MSTKVAKIVDTRYKAEVKLSELDVIAVGYGARPEVVDLHFRWRPTARASIDADTRISDWRMSKKDWETLREAIDAVFAAEG